jgi:hypothetical protein
MSGYGWKYKLIGPVEVGAVLDMPAPGASNADCDLSTATVAIGGTALIEGQFSVAMGEAVDGVDWIGVTNSTEVEWPEHAEAYVGVSGPDMSDVKAVVEANAAAIADHEARITALENPVGTRAPNKRNSKSDEV